LPAVPAVYIQIVGDIQISRCFLRAVAKPEADGVPDYTFLLQFQPQMLTLAANLTLVNDFNMAADKGGQWITGAERSQPLYLFESFPGKD
jgi:hypothetical protein